MDDQATVTRPSGPFATGPIERDPGPIASGERDPNFDNQPPLEERILMDFMEDLERPGELGAPSIKSRIDQLLASAERAPAQCDSESIAGGISDLCKQAREVSARLDNARERHNRPLLNAQRSLKARADGLISPLESAIGKLRGLLDDFARKETARIAEERRREEEARRIAEEAARSELEAKGLADAIPADQPLFSPPPPRQAPPLARGDYGARLGSQKVYCHKIESVRKLPDRLLKHPKVVEVLDKLVAAEIRSAKGQIEIGGVQIWEDTKARIG